MEFISGNIYVRPNLLEKKGDKTAGHLHKFDHTTIFFRGSFHIRAARKYRQYECAACHHVFESRLTISPDCPSCGDKIDKKNIGEREELVAERDFTAPSHCLIKADIEHEIVALEDSSLYWCVYSHRTPQGKVTQIYEGWDAATR